MGIFSKIRGVQEKPQTEVIEKSAEFGNFTSARDLAMFLDGALKTDFNTQFDYSANVREAYLNNPVSYYCINLIVSAAIQPRWELYVGDKEVEKEPKGNPLLGVYRFMDRPNEKQSLEDFIKLLFIHYYLAGEAFVYRVPDAKAFARGNGKLYLIAPDKVVIQNKEYIIDGRIHVPMVNEDGTRDILHIAEWHPNSDRGMSHLQPAWAAISNINEAQRWNHSVLKNSGKLSIVAVLKSFGASKGSTLSKDQLDSLNDDLAEFATGSNRGRPFVATGDWNFTELGLNNKELEWLTGMEAMARNIALALGVDPVLLSLPGDSTYNNKREAFSALFKNTALPQLQRLVGSIEHWLKEIVPGDWEIRFNLDDIPALEPEREKLWDRQSAASDILTVNERRALLGYEPVDGGDELKSVSAPQPEQPAAPADQPQEDNQTTEPTVEEGNTNEAS